MSIRLNQFPPKAGKVSSSTKLATEDPNDETNKTRMVSAPDLIPYTYSLSDEDSPISSGLLYTSEATATARTIKDAIISLKNAPTGSTIEVDMLKETGVNTNVFATIFTTRPTIMINEFTSETSIPVPILNTNIWEKGRRMQFVLTINDTNFAATGLKGTLKA